MNVSFHMIDYLKKKDPTVFFFNMINSRIYIMVNATHY